MRLALAGFFVMLSWPAMAEITLGKFKTIETRFGVIGVTWRPEGQEFVSWKGQPVPGLETAEITIAGGYALEGEPFDWVLFETRHGGNMCPYAYVLAKISAEGVQRTEEFGQCLGAALDLRVAPGQITLELGDGDIRYDRQVFVYSGATSTRTAVPATLTAAAAGPADQVTRWQGQALYSVLQDPAEIARFASIMSLDQLEELRLATDVGTGAIRQGDWVIGTGCQRHLCNAVAGLWAIRISDGQPVAAFVYDTAPAAIVGDPALFNDPALGGQFAQLQGKMRR